ncbi:MAG: peptidyl-prolyl cis-trans isomerase [Lysobacterales bacterium]
MFPIRTIALILALVAGSAGAQTPPANAPVTPPANGCARPECPLAQRGQATITVADLQAKLRTLEPKQQNVLLSDPKQLTTVIENLLITRQLAMAADQEAAAADPIVQARIRQLSDEVLSIYRLDEVRAERIRGDFERLAKEHYLTNKAAMVQPRSVTVRHLLIDTKTRSDAEALKMAQDLAKTLAGADDKTFTDAVLEKSDDPSKGLNGGIFEVVEGNPQLDPAFVRGALALTKAGELSPPVKSSFGYHLLRAVEVKPAGTVPFEQAKPTIIEKLRQDARRRVVSEYRNELMAEGELKLYQDNMSALILSDDPSKPQQ